VRTHKYSTALCTCLPLHNTDKQRGDINRAQRSQRFGCRYQHCNNIARERCNNSMLPYQKQLQNKELRNLYCTPAGRDVCAVAQAVSRRLPTATPRVRAQIKTCWICSRQSCTMAGSLPILRLPLPILIPPTAPHSPSIIRAWYNRPNSSRRTEWTQSHPTLHTN
jgi:hypothetical protein